MDPYVLACFLATVVAMALRRYVVVRSLCIAFLLWVGAKQYLDVRQVERTLMQVDVPATARAVRPTWNPASLVGILQRTPGFVAFACSAVLALVPVERRKRLGPGLDDAQDA